MNDKGEGGFDKMTILPLHLQRTLKIRRGEFEGGC